VRVLVRTSFDASKHRYGSPRIHEGLLEQDVRVSRKRVIRLMQEEGLKARVRKRFTGTLRVNADPSLKLDPKIASAMYHIAQEAVENAVQHSSCSVIEIAVKSTRTGSSLEVRDNGRGFDPADTLGACRGLGLLSMEHYAAQAGLDLSIQSDREAGTVVRASAPEPE
jgi:signal transduction histidine kinase